MPLYSSISPSDYRPFTTPTTAARLIGVGATTGGTGTLLQGADIGDGLTTAFHITVTTSTHTVGSAGTADVNVFFNDGSAKQLSAQADLTSDASISSANAVVVLKAGTSVSYDVTMTGLAGGAKANYSIIITRLS